MPKGYVAVHFLFRPTKDADTRWLAKAIAGVPRHFNGGPRLRSRFGRIFTILNAPGIMKSRGIRLRLRTEVTAMMLDILDAAAVATRKGVTQGVLDVAEEMKAHPERRYPLSDLAARFGTSLTSVVNDFKAAVGFTPHAYLLHCRIDLAKRSLKAGYSMRAVADMTGFPSAQHLATTFRNITGQTPSGWLACT